MIDAAIRQLSSVVFAGFLLVASTVAALAAEILTARQALEGVENGTTVLVDIRTRQEWRETGIASPAIPLSMHEDGFLEGIEQLQAQNPGKTIALICAVGGRTAYMTNLLEKGGYDNIADVSEGMVGGRNGTGWIPSGMPVKRYTGE